jgi:Protein of unknown function (DUF1559)
MSHATGPKAQSSRFNEIASWMLLFVFFGAVLWLLTPPVYPVRSRAPDPCRQHLKQIGIALHNYHDSYGTLPPAVTLGPDNKPYHSWRVLILLFMGDDEKKLYVRYHMNEPWDGPNNSKLLAERPKFYECHHAKGKMSKQDTSYVAVIGDETAWPPHGVRNLKDMTDGTSNTILVVEVKDAGIAWSAPDDLKINEATSPPSDASGRVPSSRHGGGGSALMGDGARRFISSQLDPKTWAALLTVAGGESLGDF